MTKRAHRTPIGIDVDDRSIAMVQFTRHAGGLQLENAAIISRLDRGASLTAEEASRLASFLDRRGFLGKSVILGVPDRMLLSGMLELPAATAPTQLAQIARLEMARMHKADAASFESGYWPLPAAARAGDVTMAMAAACDCEDANGLLDLFEGQGLDVCALDILAWARARACASLIAEPSAVTALLDIRWDSTAISIVFQDTVVYERSLTELGLSNLHKEVTTQLGLSDEVGEFLLLGSAANEQSAAAIAGTDAFAEMRHRINVQLEAIVREIRASCGYVTNRFAGSTTGELLVFGPGAGIAGIDVMLSATSDMQARLVAPTAFASASANMKELDDNPAFTVAAGLALFEQ